MENINKLAADLACFTEAYDPYGFRDAYDDMDPAIYDNINLLSTDPEGINDYLWDCLDDMKNDPEYFKDMITTCAALIDRIETIVKEEEHA